jgi:hypothetical protein
MISSGVRRPSPSDLKIAAMAASTSCELFIGGIVTLIGGAFRGGQIRSSIIRRQDTYLFSGEHERSRVSRLPTEKVSPRDRDLSATDRR